MNFFGNGYSALLGGPLSLGVIFLSLTGFIRRLKEGTTFLELFVLFYLGLILLYSASDSYRYLIPVFPLCVFYALRGLSGFALPKNLSKHIFAGLLSAITLSYAGAYGKAGFNNPAEGIAPACGRCFQTGISKFLKFPANALNATRREGISMGMAPFHCFL